METVLIDNGEVYINGYKIETVVEYRVEHEPMGQPRLVLELTPDRTIIRPGAGFCQEVFGGA